MGDNRIGKQCSSIKDFNDPFEFKSTTELRGPRDQVRAWFQGRLKDRNPTLSQEELSRQVQKALGNMNECEGKLEFRVPEEMADLSKDVGVCCFSEVPDSLLMWSHYADGHRGFCLEFGHDGNDPFVARNMPPRSGLDGVTPEPVKYSDDWPIVNRLKDDDITSFQKACFRKSPKWKYEREWRMVDTSGHGTRKFDPRFLTGVILGCEMPNGHKKQIREWCHAGEVDVAFYQANPRGGIYALEISPA